MHSKAMSPTSCASNHPLILVLRGHFAAFGLGSCHFTCCPKLCQHACLTHYSTPRLRAFVPRSGAVAPHVRAPIVPRVCAPIAPLALARCCRAPLHLSHSAHLLPCPNSRIILALVSCSPQAHPCCRQDLAQGYKPSHVIRPTRPKVVTSSYLHL